MQKRKEIKTDEIGTLESSFHQGKRDPFLFRFLGEFSGGKF
jgi:hypothetical protein